MQNFLEFFSLKSRPYWFLCLIILLFSVFPALNLQPLDRDESRFMQATTQMFETGDFISINFQDDQRNKKPIGIHWLQAAFLKLTGQGLSHEAFYFRIASILGAILCAISTFLIGTNLFNRKIGLFAGILISSSLLLTTEAHIAKTDAALAGFIALSFYCLSVFRFAKANIKINLLFWAAFAIAILIKGPVPIMAIGFTILFLWILEKNIDWIKPLFDIRGIALFFAITLPWFILIGIKTDGQFYIEAIGKDLGEKVTGKQENSSLPPGLHALISPIILWPASLGIGAAIMASIKEFKNEKIKFILAIIIPTWLIFELSTGKLLHYTLPVHFAIAVLISYAITNGYWRNWGKWLGVAIFAFASFIIALLPLYLGIEYYGAQLKSNYFANIFSNPNLNLAFWASIFIFIFSIIGIFFAIKNKIIAIPILICVGLIFSNGVKAGLIPNIEQLNVSKNIADEMTKLGINPRNNHALNAIIGAGYQEPSLIFLTRSDSHLASIEDAIKNAKPGAPFIVEEREFLKFNNELEKIGLKHKQMGKAIEGINYSKGKKVKIYYGIVEKIPAP